VSNSEHLDAGLAGESPEVRVAVISDIHADLPALERVLSTIRATEPDEVWCLGDVVGLGGRNPAEAVGLVRENCAVVLAGNHDAWVTGAMVLDLLSLPRQREELTWQRAELSDEQLAWLTARPSYAQHAGVELWHGSADDPLTGWIFNARGGRCPPQSATGSHRLGRSHAPTRCCRSSPWR
jgi:hypothetical protein